MPARVVTLSTDIGAVYAAQMKGVLLRHVPPGHIVELTHDLPAHGIVESSFVLRQMTAAFPPPTVHVAVVDPGVGGGRAPIAISCRNGDVLVGPDNGLLIPTRDRCGGGDAVRLGPDIVGPGAEVSRTFEGRDLFAPAAGRIASGTPPGALGSAWTAKELRLPMPERRGRELRGEVLHEDRFGNLVTNLPTRWAEGVRGFEVRMGARPPVRALPAGTYAELAPRGLGVIGSSFGTLELSVREGRASGRLRAGVGTVVRLAPWARPRRAQKAPK